MKKALISLAIVSIIVSSCGTYTGKGSLIGGGAGTAIGAGIGALIGGGKGAAIGAAVGAAAGAGTGAIIGKSMDKKKAKLEQELAENAQVETVTDSQGLTAIKVTFNADMTFNTGKAELSATAQEAIKQFAYEMTTDDMINTAIKIMGHTDNTGSAEINEKLSLQRAQSVGNLLKANNVFASRITEAGMSFNDPIADNATAEGRKANRRVEVYVLATDAMVKQAEAGNLQ